MSESGKVTYQKSLLCYIYGRADDWEGICVDLDISVQGHSEADVMEALKQSVLSYCRAASLEDNATFDRLMSRKSPWHVRAYHWAAAGIYRRLDGLTRIFDTGTDRTYRIATRVPCHG